MKVEMVSPSKLRPAPYNPRKIPDRAIEKLLKSIETFGFANPILAQKGTQTVIAGHARLKAALKSSMKAVPVIFLDLDDAKAKAYNLADNRLAEETEWDFTPLAESLLELDHLNFDLGATGFDAKEIENLMTWTPNGGAQEDDFDEEPPKKPQTKSGDLYELGRHRLLCGDATDKETFAKLMGDARASMVFTDPPYGVSYAEKNTFLNAIAPANRVQTPLQGDHEKPETMRELWRTAFANMLLFCDKKACYYSTGPQGGDLLLLLLLAITEAGWRLKHMLVWAKNNHVLGRSDYHYQHEPILYGWNGGGHNFYGGRSETSLWLIDKPQRSPDLSVMKPVALPAKAVKNSSKPGQIILDPFVGAGSTLVACEQLDRRCFAMDIDPVCCDLVVRRYAKLKDVDPKIYFKAVKREGKRQKR